MKAKNFFSAGVLLAVALIFSCSSSDDDDNGGGGDDLPSSSSGGDNGGGGGSSSSVGGGSSPSGGIDLTNLPLSYDGVLEGKIDVFLLDGDWYAIIQGKGGTRTFIGGDTLPAGKIENGILSLSLPSIDSKNSKYRFESWYSELDGNDEVSIVPQDLAFHQSGPLFAIIPGKGSCYIKGILKNEAMNYGRAVFIYNSASGSVSGTGLYGMGGEVEYRQEGKFNLNISQGWQVVYDYAWNRDMYENISYAKIAHITTDLPANTTVEWKCSSNYDDDDDNRSSSSSGGGDLPSSSSGGGGGGGGPEPSTNANGDQTYKVEDVPVYILGLPSRPYEGNVTLVGFHCNSGTVGRIENGKLFLDLPSIEDPDIFDEDGICEEEFAIEGSDLYAELIGTTKGLTQISARDDLKGVAAFIYASKTGEFSPPDGPTLNFKKGWNIVYVLIADMSFTVVQPSGLTWEWALND